MANTKSIRSTLESLVIESSKRQGADHKALWEFYLEQLVRIGCLEKVPNGGVASSDPIETESIFPRDILSRIPRGGVASSDPVETETAFSRDILSRMSGTTDESQGVEISKFFLNLLTTALKPSE